jgi:integrase
MKTKNGSPRRVPLTIRTKELLNFLKNETRELSQYVFLYRARGSLNAVPYKNPFGSWKTALRRSNIDQSLHLHDLRHTFASRLVSNGVPIYDVSKLLGHKSITMTMQYAHLAPAAFDTAIGTLEKEDQHEVYGEFDQVLDFKTEKEKRGGK